MQKRRNILLLFLAFCVTLQGFAQTAVLDDLGNLIVIKSPAKRIVSLAPSITETLFAIGAGEQVIGVTDYCDFPLAASEKARVGGLITPNIEVIVSLQPDLVILSMEGNEREDYRRLKSFGLRLFVSNPRNLTGIHKSIQDLGQLTGRSLIADTLISSMKERADSVIASTRGIPPKGVLLFVSLQPLIVAGGGTYLDELLTIAGGENLAADAATPYPALSREAVIAYNPDAMIIMSDALKDSSNLGGMFPEWATVKAFSHNKYFFIDSNLASRPGPRAIDALEAFSTLIMQ